MTVPPRPENDSLREDTISALEKAGYDNIKVEVDPRDPTQFNVSFTYRPIEPYLLIDLTLDETNSSKA